MNSASHEETSREGRGQLDPAPRPTTAPFFLALGITLAFLGLISSGVVAVAGLILFTAALTRWILDISRSSNNHED